MIEKTDDRLPATEKKNNRYGLLDTIRGLTLLSMILYHGAWDLVYLYGIEWDWYRGKAAYGWQQSICWTFILLSGFCWSLGKKHLKRGLLVFGGGLLVTIVTLIAMPENRVVFGVLTLIGSCMLLMVWLEKGLRYVPEIGGLLGSLFFFWLTRNVNSGFLGFENVRLLKIPGEWYQNYGTAYLGFPPAAFYSTDYFSLVPWLFLFISGYFLFRIFDQKKWLLHPVFQISITPFAFIGRHSLLIYLLHQPVLYLIGTLCF